jgi:hypothetical protein
MLTVSLLQPCARSGCRSIPPDHSEAEWEFCCRAGTTTQYAFGDNITRQRAQFSDRAFGGAKQTIEVGKFPPNAWRLHDMHGNVWETAGVGALAGIAMVY